MRSPASQDNVSARHEHTHNEDFRNGHDDLPKLCSIHSTSTTSGEKRTLDFAQKIEKKLAEYNASQSVVKKWLFEGLSWLASALCMAAVVIIYLYLKHKPLQKAGYLLTLANVLGKVASAALIIPTSEALGQLKWHWFHKSNAMWDFEIFDKASRGAWGAVMLLFRTKGRSLAALGAILIVLLLAIDTFFQQVVELPTRWAVTQTSGLIPHTLWYNPVQDQIFSEGALYVVRERRAQVVIDDFLYGNGTQPISFGSGIRPDIPLTCPTSNCTWPIHETLGVCSQCADISELAEYACVQGKDDWTIDSAGGYKFWNRNITMCGYFLNATNQDPVLLSGSIIENNGTIGEVLLGRLIPLLSAWEYKPLYGNASIRFKQLRNTIVNIVIASAADGTVASIHRRERPNVQECAVSWCVKTIQASYLAGTYREDVLDTTYNTTAGPSPWSSKTFQTDLDNGTETAYHQNINIRFESRNAVGKAQTYGTSNDTAAMIGQSFQEGVPSSTTWSPHNNLTRMRWKTYKRGPPWQRELDFDPWRVPNNVSRHMERFATSLTNVIRSDSSNEMLHGISYEVETFISIRWGWLAFPFTLLLLSFVFLLSTIIKTSRDTSMGMWKTSAMPTLIYSLPKEAQGQFNDPAAWHTGDGVSKKTRIKLLPEKGWRISGQSFLSRLPKLPSGERVPSGWI